MAALRSTGLLLSRPFVADFGAALSEAERACGLEIERIVLPADPDARLDDALRERIELAFFSVDVFPAHSRAFFAAALGAPRLRWLQVFNAGVDHPIFQRFLERGVRLSTAAGASALPIAQTAITGLLMLARGFPAWLDAQRRHAWEPHTDAARALPGTRELGEQTLVVIGLGNIGREIARLGRALGLHVIGVRRSPRSSDDPVDELVAPDELARVLPRADWLALACPLTDATRGLIDAEALARLPHGARLLNVARGEVVDEEALIRALRERRLGGAYLDVFRSEPLPAESPLWELPDVIVTPHNSSASPGNARRQSEVFLFNLLRFGRGEPLRNEVAPTS